jgi:hypothetical protein
MGKRANFNPRNLFGSNVLRRNMNTSPQPLDIAAPMDVAGSGLLLDAGLGAAYNSPDEFTHLTGKPVIGLGLSQVSEKLKNLKSSKFSKPKNIRFTL